MFGYQVRPFVDLAEKKVFKENYESVSGIPLPDHYLYTNEVFGLIAGNRVIGGFIVGSNHPLRTYRIFANEINWPGINSRLGHLELCEVCCLWLSRKYWSWRATSFLWFSVARIVSKRKEDRVVFGTVSEGNRLLYEATLHAQLIHRDQVDIRGNKKSSWIYAIPVKWFLIDIIWWITVRFYHHVLKPGNKPGSKYLKKQLAVKSLLK